ncbi:hypothetical protein P5673_003773 [Acropora cervicornis]|uniref:Uncharacterized protein n=1 Tax=Acropora cervicornis TaxID=6130 RepID=A0AAD9R168_ACRCE|nr:hypothetical protein P5673_003773 [Acropora cervicornis]
MVLNITASEDNERTNKGDEQFGVKRIDRGQLNNLLEIFQSAYKKGHSTQKALRRTHDDLLRAIDDNACVIVFFWTSQRSLTLLTPKYYSHDLGVATAAKVMLWPGCAYLSNRFQYVREGSVSGPIVCSMHTAPIADVIKRNGMGFHFYTDDTQIYKPFHPADALQSKSVIERRIQDLKLNGDKTELLVLAARHSPPPPPDSILIGADILLKLANVPRTSVFGLIACSLWIELLKLYIPNRALRSTKKKLLIVPKCNLKTYGYSVSSQRAPTLWNALLNDIRQVEHLQTCKSNLKAHLFWQLSKNDELQEEFSEVKEVQSQDVSNSFRQSTVLSRWNNCDG